MSDYTAQDLTVVIPTRDRGDILRRTIAGLRTQTVAGFEVVVVVDGLDQGVPDGLEAVHTLVKPHGGPGAARNLAVRQSSRPLVLFLGDDMIPEPELVARHLAVHNARPESEVAVLGRATWHPEVDGEPLMRWIDWSGAQFEYPTVAGEDAGFGRFYSCNVSLKRALFLAAGGFDEDFIFDYEDLDLGWRLAQHGLILLYEPRAVTRHLHHYDFDRLVARFCSKARGEHLMAAKHDWFQPWYADQFREATALPPAGDMWPRIVEWVPHRFGRLRALAERRATTWYRQHLAPFFFQAWESAQDLEELRAYLGPRYEHRRLERHEREVEEEAEAIGDEGRFYRTSEAYLYDLTAFAMSGTKTPYLTDLQDFVPTGGSILDYGCGIGSDGLRLLERGYRVAFADFDNPSTAYLRWRLDRRGVAAEIYDLDRSEIPGGFDAVFSFDVIEHVEDPFAFLASLERLASIVAVNFLEPEPGDTHLHKPLPIDELLEHASQRGLLRYRRYHGRSHLAIYRAKTLRPAGSSAPSSASV